MLKDIHLVLNQIKYRGDSIGDDIRTEIEVLGQILRLDKRIKAGNTTKINEEVGKFTTDQKLFKAGVHIAIIEKDLLFNDVGEISDTLIIDTSQIKPQRFVFEIPIRETRSIFGTSWGKAKATLEITLEAETSETIQYVPDEDAGDGWLKARLEQNKSVESLPAYLKVKIERADTKREYLTILEGSYQGKTASVALRKDGSSQFISKVRHEAMVRAKYFISKKTFILNGKKYQTVDYPQSPWKRGLYDIEIPDYPHQGGRNYLDKSARALTWFRIGHSGDRYLHTGGYSRGCMTVIETTRWMEIYHALIKARKDTISVGVLEIVD